MSLHVWSFDHGSCLVPEGLVCVRHRILQVRAGAVEDAAEEGKRLLPYRDNVYWAKEGYGGLGFLLGLI